MSGSATDDPRRGASEGSRNAGGERPPRRVVDGILLLDKPLGITSNGALQRAKHAYRAKKAGHTGTLDPLATGLLPLCFGEATKFSQFLTDADKVYRADVTLGITTETGDAEGRVTRRHPVAARRDEIESALAGFRGEILQTPHRYSALKRDGRALYDYARAGEDVPIAARPVRIDELELEAWTPPVATLRIRCSKGTYVRSLAEALGEALGCGGHVSSLRRLAAGGFDIADAVGLDQLEAEEDDSRLARLLPVTALVAGLPRVELPAAAAARLTHGVPVPIETPPPGFGQGSSAVAVFGSGESGSGGAFLGVGSVSAWGDRGWSLVPLRLLDSSQRAN